MFCKNRGKETYSDCTQAYNRKKTSNKGNFLKFIHRFIDDIYGIYADIMASWTILIWEALSGLQPPRIFF